MFRVSPGTVLRRAAVVSLLALSTNLVACGDDETDSAAGVSAPRAADASTPSTPASKPKNTDPNKGNPKADKISPEEAAKVSDTPETNETVAAASERERGARQLGKQIKSAVSALRQAGEKTDSEPRTQDDGEASITVGDTTILFYSSDRRAAESAQQFQKFSAMNPGHGRVARAENRVYVLTAKDDVDESAKADFRKLRDIVERDV